MIVDCVLANILPVLHFTSAHKVKVVLVLNDNAV
jgi:hypothetical protein